MEVYYCIDDLICDRKYEWHLTRFENRSIIICGRKQYTYMFDYLFIYNRVVDKSNIGSSTDLQYILRGINLVLDTEG